MIDRVQAFFYDWIDRTHAKKGKPLPEKIGSMQYFLHGFQGETTFFVILFEKWSRPRFSADASDFLRRYPWPGRAISDTFDDTTHRKGNFAKKFMSAMKVICGRTGQEEDLYDDEIEEQSMFFDQDGLESGRPFYWTRQLQQSFREELEKYIIMFSPSGVFR
jgi:phosphatidylinositol 4-kinase type 2